MLVPGPDLDDGIDLTPPSNYLAAPTTRSPAAPESLSQAERSRMFDAANKALRLWPGPVGTLISREIKTFLEMGFRFGHHAKMHALVEQIEKETVK